MNVDWEKLIAFLQECPDRAALLAANPLLEPEAGTEALKSVEPPNTTDVDPSQGDLLVFPQQGTTP